MTSGVLEMKHLFENLVINYGVSAPTVPGQGQLLGHTDMREALLHFCYVITRLNHAHIA